MARYTCSLIVKIPLNQLSTTLEDILKACNLDLLYETADYIMAREKTGQVSFHQLVTVEVLIDKTTATDENVKINFVIKNEELPLQVNNHCKQLFDLLKDAIAHNDNWQLIENVAT